MRQPRLRAGLAALVTILILVAAVLVLRPGSQQSLGQPKGKKNDRVRTPEKPVPMAADMVQLRIAMGFKDKKGTPWDGSISVSEGKVHSVELMRGNAKGKLDGVKWLVRSVRKMKGKQIIRPLLHVNLQAPLTATVTVNTAQGNFKFKLGKIPVNVKRKFLKGRVQIDRQSGATRLARPDTEDDYPATAKDSQGNIWLAYNEYTPGQKVINERVLAGNFDLLVPHGNGDQVRLKQFDGDAWRPSIAVTGTGLDIWRPAVAVDGKGRVHVSWAQQKDKSNWYIHHRVYDPEKKEWSKVFVNERENKTGQLHHGMHVVSTTDNKGNIFLAFQVWVKEQGCFHIGFRRIFQEPGKDDFGLLTRKINKPCNHWSPAIAADSKGNVYVAYDTYENQNYDVHMEIIEPDLKQKTMKIASSPRFEARPSIVVDKNDRVWIAYEEGDEQWGKDYATQQFLKIDDIPGNLGKGLYLRRTIKVKCLANGKLMQPAGDLQAAFGKTLPRGKSVPRLGIDGAGGLWLWLRHHPTAGGGGEVWVSYALRFDGKDWSAPRLIPNSQNLMDNRPALVGHKNVLMAVFSGDGRNNARTHKQTDLFAMLLKPNGKTLPAPLLVADQPVTKRELKSVHPNEAAHVARIRNYRIEYGGKKLQLYRGEFHRHTEYTAHRDQDGLLEDSWRYSLDAAGMDWMGNGDHDNGFHHEYPWWQIQKMTDLFHNPPVFVAAQTHERSNRFPNGHRNVILPKRGIRPLPRGNLKGDAKTGTPDTKMLYAYLRHFGGMCASHTSGTNMGTDWRDNDPLVEPVVEIYQGHRHSYEHFGAPRSPNKKKQIGGYQPTGFVWNALGKGYKLGFQASSDHVSTHMSYAVVLTADISRKGLIDAFKRRHSYGATDNIIMDVRSGKHIMGDIFKTDKRPKLEIKIKGTGPIAKVHVVKGNEYVYSPKVPPNTMDYEISWTDAKAVAGKEAYYYVRVEQADGNLAWASPMWITYVKK